MSNEANPSSLPGDGVDQLIVPFEPSSNDDNNTWNAFQTDETGDSIISISGNTGNMNTDTILSVDEAMSLSDFMNMVEEEIDGDDKKFVYILTARLRTKDLMRPAKARELNNPDYSQLTDDEEKELRGIVETPTTKEIEAATECLRDWLKDLPLQCLLAPRNGSAATTESDSPVSGIDWNHVLSRHGGTSKKPDLLDRLNGANLAGVFNLAFKDSRNTRELPAETALLVTSAMTRSISKENEQRQTGRTTHTLNLLFLNGQLSVDQELATINSLRSALQSAQKSLCRYQVLGEYALLRKPEGWEILDDMLKGTGVHKIASEWKEVVKTHEEWQDRQEQRPQSTVLLDLNFSPSLERFQDFLESRFWGMEDRIDETINARLTRLITDTKELHEQVIARDPRHINSKQVAVETGMRVISELLEVSGESQPFSNLSKFLQSLSSKPLRMEENCQLSARSQILKQWQKADD